MARRGSGRSRMDKRDQDDIVATFGANLKTARLKVGLTQAQRACFSSTSRSSSRGDRMSRSPRHKCWRRLLTEM